MLNLAETLRLHALYTAGDPAGVRANLSGANLEGTYLVRADLGGANLGGANLGGADLRGANLSRANLSRASLSGADLSRASLRGANLEGTYLGGANLGGADLRGADLRGANLSRAPEGIELALARCAHIPSTGAFEGWKKCRDGVLVRLLIPGDAERSHGSGRKCRASRVEVLEVIGAEVGVSIRDGVTEYRVGQAVAPDGWDTDRWSTCGRGIHFYLTREEAEAHI